MSTTYKNLLLRALSHEEVVRLEPRAVAFEVGHEMEFPERPIRSLFFVEEGMASITTTFENGTQVEVGMVGYEGAVGISSLMGTKRSLNRIYTQIAGHGYAVPFRLASKQFNEGGLFQSLVLRYVQSQLVQAMQSAGCNAKHNVHQRLSRWLLTCKDRVRSERFHMSHEFLADMLGAGRPSVTLAAEGLRAEKLIEYRRGLIEILDVPGLERRACECYYAVRNHLHNFAEYDDGMTEGQSSLSRERKGMAS